MPLAGPGVVAVPGREGSQGHALIQLHPVAYNRGLAHHNARAVVNKEVVADLCAGVDVNARVAVSVFGHHPGQNRHLHLIQLMGHPVYQDGKQPRIREQYLLPGPRRRVPVKSSLQIQLHLLGDFGQARHHFRGQLLGLQLLLLGQCQGDLAEKLLFNAL